MENVMQIIFQAKLEYLSFPRPLGEMGAPAEAGEGVVPYGAKHREFFSVNPFRKTNI
jgi:hypothetical protein